MWAVWCLIPHTPPILAKIINPKYPSTWEWSVPCYGNQIIIYYSTHFFVLFYKLLKNCLEAVMLKTNESYRGFKYLRSSRGANITQFEHFHTSTGGVFFRNIRISFLYTFIQEHRCCMSHLVMT